MRFHTILLRGASITNKARGTPFFLGDTRCFRVCVCVCRERLRVCEYARVSENANKMCAYWVDKITKSSEFTCHDGLEGLVKGRTQLGEVLWTQNYFCSQSLLACVCVSVCM